MTMKNKFNGETHLEENYAMKNVDSYFVRKLKLYIWNIVLDFKLAVLLSIKLGKLFPTNLIRHRHTRMFLTFLLLLVCFKITKYNQTSLICIAKLRPSSSSSWPELALLSLFPSSNLSQPDRNSFQSGLVSSQAVKQSSFQVVNQSSSQSVK